MRRLQPWEGRGAGARGFQLRGESWNGTHAGSTACGTVTMVCGDRRGLPGQPCLKV